jgi:signal transduction histidine kinase
VAGIVDAHGGRVHAGGAAGGGAAFVVTLPAATPADGDRAVGPAS